MRTEESLLSEYSALADGIVLDFRLRYKRAIEQNSTLSAYDFYESTMQEFREQLAGVATELLHKAIVEGIDPDLTLTTGFQKISLEYTRAYIDALLSK